MKLLTYTSRLQLIFLLAIFAIFSVLFYLILSWMVLQNVDEVLFNRKINLLAYLNQKPDAPFKGDNPLDDFTFYAVEESEFQEKHELYKDTLIYEPVDDELDEYRKLTTYVRLHGDFYRLEIVKPHLEGEEMIATIAITLGGLFLVLTISFYFSQRIISRNIWKPFFSLLEQLRQFRFDTQKIPQFPKTSIDEFNKLSESLHELVQKNTVVFNSQKQFIENASHEMQTPLSVIQVRLEELIGQAGLTKEQSRIIEGIIHSTQRLKKLNKTLLLLSKIENRQFLFDEKVDLSEIIDQSMEYFEELKEGKNISLTINIKSKIPIKGNISLTEILVQNLLKNAFVHNEANGRVTINLESDKLTIMNTGERTEYNNQSLDRDRLFSRFYKKSRNPDTWGLGLAIALKIAETSSWELHYREESGQHVFEVNFR
ncbi:sensor histidine kinase [Cyclobacterium plantarum]|uniref:histidine kinase n=1 Tax=Cyclobacterium plantarum TaxID=2716263 RepID=A0ABX0H4A1_9BACT|nr:HAMP domain-containing sensor histidine kinase [Cyclobacterium plantarum]NHE56454.1 HAMP domain-containing histidine kinase [Cyclobacterium plantarum]